VSGAVPTISITHCLCRRTSFSDLLPLARASHWSLETLMAETGCGRQCGLCRPYLRRMLETGETVFHELLTERP
jgi:bacterioferritin-associated ferredoxin